MGGASPGFVGVGHVVGAGVEGGGYLEEEKRGDGVDPAAIVFDECGEAGAGEGAAEDPDEQDVAGSDVEVGRHGDDEVESGRCDEEPQGAGIAQPSAGDGEEGEGQGEEFGERGLDEEDGGEVVPDAMTVDAAEEEAGHVVGHLANVGETVEVAFGEQAEVGDEEEAAGFDAGEGADVVGERG